MRSQWKEIFYMNIPKKIYIENHLWRVKKRRNLKYNNTKCYGLCDYETRTLFIDSSLNGFLLKEALVHEITHALMHELKLRISYNTDEKICDSVGRTIAKLFNLTMK